MTSTSIVSQIPKLKGTSNFDAWYNGLKGVAKVNGAWKILTVRTKDDKGQFQEPELDSVMELLKDRERRHAENDDNPTKALKSGAKGDGQRGKQRQHSGTSKEEKGCGYCHSSTHQEGKCW